MNIDWKKVFLSIVKYAIAAIAGAVGITITGCSVVPVFTF